MKADNIKLNKKICLLKIILYLSITIITFSIDIYSQDDIIRVDTNLVNVPATVLNRDGRYITNLKKENFQIFEDGVEQEISLFETTEQQLTVLFLIDTSSSVKEDAVYLARGASVFVSQLRPDDQIIAATFSYNVRMLIKATKIRDLKKGIKIRQYPRDPETMVYDAVEFALKKMKKIRGRKAIVLFSDGKGSGLSANAKSTLRDAEEGEALIYTVQSGAFRPPSKFVEDVKQFYKRAETANIYMEDLAKVTGGKRYQIENISNLEKTFSEIVNELGQQYSIGYYPKVSGKKGERRQIKVKVNVPNAAVRARESYIVGANKN